MQYYRCKCGDSEAWCSDSPWPCARCKKCGSDLAGGPDLHRDPRPHEFLEYPVETDDGQATLSRCRWCMKTKKQIEAAEKKRA